MLRSRSYVSFIALVPQKYLAITVNHKPAASFLNRDRLDLLCSIPAPAPQASKGKVSPKACSIVLGRPPLACIHRRNDLRLGHAPFLRTLACMGMESHRGRHSILTHPPSARR